VLSTMFLAIAVNHAGEHAGDVDLTEDDLPETMEATASGAANGQA
jgi:hypothetical protein